MAGADFDAGRRLEAVDAGAFQDVVHQRLLGSIVQVGAHVGHPAFAERMDGNRHLAIQPAVGGPVARQRAGRVGIQQLEPLRPNAGLAGEPIPLDGDGGQQGVILLHFQAGQPG